MNNNKSHWVLGLLYINPEDSRVFVPLPCKLGVALNFGNPRVVTPLCWFSALGLLGLFTAPILVHPSYFLRNPTTSLLWLLAWLIALLIIRLNGCFGWSDYREIPLASYGLVAVSVGLGIQNLILGSFALWRGEMVNWSWAHGLVIGPVCAVAQTFGKWAAIVLLLKIRPAPSRLALIRYGLLVGLGFTIYEIAIVYFPAAWAQAALGHLAVWERVSVSMFHIYSAGLVALALWSRRPHLLVFVVAMHSVMDGLAVATRSLQLSFDTVEVIFSALAAITWCAFLVAARAPHSGGSPDSGVRQCDAPNGIPEAPPDHSRASEGPPSEI